jgi:hypothetical protein
MGTNVLRKKAAASILRIAFILQMEAAGFFELLVLI